MTTCSRLCVQEVGGLFAGKDSSLKLSENAKSILEAVVPSQADFVFTTMNNILRCYNADGVKFEYMPEKFAHAQRLTKVERSALEMAALGRYSLPTTDFSLMLYDGGVVYSGLMLKAAGLQAWEDAGMLVIETLYTDYWRSWSLYKNEWEAYDRAARSITSVPDPVVELIKAATIFNSCSNAVEQRSNHAGYPSGIRDVVDTLRYKSFESTGYVMAAIYAHVRDICFESDDLVFAGLLLILSHDVFDYPRDCYEENYSNCCMILHGLGEDGFSVGCAILFAVWNNLDSFIDATARLFKHCLSTSMAGNLSVPRYNGKEQLRNCTSSGVWSGNVKAIAVNVIEHMTGVSICWPEDVATTTIGDATHADYHRMAVACLYGSTAEQVTDLCVEWANEIINSTIFRGRCIKYIKRVSTERGPLA
ncbi:hypothetical protein BGZ72_005786 [Mortierella alpina]|nr:hypothetical protein BGZ72_005786 [Mortierella alpina]